MRMTTRARCGHTLPAEAVVHGEVDGAALLDELGVFIERFQVLPSQEVRDLLGLWILHSQTLESAWATPYPPRE